MREAIMEWMMEDHRRVVTDAAEKFGKTPQQIHDILAGKG